MVGMPTRKENSVAAGRFNPSSRHSRMVEPDRDVPGNTAAINWPTPTATTTGQVISSLSFFPRNHHSMATKPMPPIEPGPGNGRELFRQFESFFSRINPTDAGDEEGDEDFQRVALRFPVAPLENEFVKPLRKQRQHGDDRAALDDDVEKVALARQPVLGDQQMAGGGNGDEFGDSLDDSQNDNGDPVRHGAWLDTKRACRARKK